MGRGRGRGGEASRDQRPSPRAQRLRPGATVPTTRRAPPATTSPTRSPPPPRTPPVPTLTGRKRAYTNGNRPVNGGSRARRSFGAGAGWCGGPGSGVGARLGGGLGGAAVRACPRSSPPRARRCSASTATRRASASPPAKAGRAPTPGPPRPPGAPGASRRWHESAIPPWTRVRDSCARAGRDRPPSPEDRRQALRLLGDLRRAATPAGALPERVDAHTGIPRSTTPLAWSHAFAILALRELWPARAAGTSYTAKREHAVPFVPCNPAVDKRRTERLRSRRAPRRRPSAVSAGITPGASRMSSRPSSDQLRRAITVRPSARAWPISESVPHSPPTAITTSPEATTARLRAWPMPVATTSVQSRIRLRDRVARERSRSPRRRPRQRPARPPPSPRRGRRRRPSPQPPPAAARPPRPAPPAPTPPRTRWTRSRRPAGPLVGAREGASPEPPRCS